MKSIWIKFLIAFILSLLLSFSYLFIPKVFFSLDNRLRDFMFIIRGELPKNNNIVIVDIDEKSLKNYGQWPWDRKTVASLLNQVSSYHPGIIGLHIVFAEEDRSSPHTIKKKFPFITQDLPNYDNILATCFQHNPIIGGYVFTFNHHTTNKEGPNIPAIVIQKGFNNNSKILSPNSLILNIPLLQQSLYSTGFFNMIPDKNGMIRSVPLIMKYKQNIYPSLALEMVRIYSGANKVKIIGNALGARSISFGKFHIPIDNFGRLFINFRGKGHHFKYISAFDILHKTINPKELEGKFILVGTSALGLYDLRSITFDSNIPGVEIHANVIDNLLTGDFLQRPPLNQLYTLSIIWFLVFTMMFIFHFVRSWLVLPFAIFFFILLTYFYYILLFSYGIILNLLFPLLAFIFTLISSISLDYFLEQKQKLEAKKMLGKKVSTAVMNYLLKHANENLISSKEIEATVFFSDIQGFTSISEKLESPAKLIKVLNAYMTPMVENIISHNGTIDKFIGDAIMAYWNAPLPVDNHADKGVQSAIEQIEMLKKVNASIVEHYGVSINIGIGIHTGVVTAGDMGSEGRSDYTVIGDNVNIASRLEGMTRYYDVQILISAQTYHALTNADYTIRPIDIVEVKGKNKPVEIYEVICNTKKITSNELNNYKNALMIFRKGDVKKARIQFLELEKRNPSKLYRLYIQRCQNFIDNPEKEFTPILKMTTK